MERNGRCYRVGNPALLITMFLIFSAVPSALSANIRVDFPEKLGLALASRLEKAASDERLVVWVNLKDRPELLDRAAAARWAKEHRNLPPVNEDYIRSISALPEIKYRVLDELSNRISVELPARAVNALIRLGFVVEIHEVEEGIPAKTVDNHVCPGDHYFQRWESWKQADGTFKDFWATHNLRPEMTAINIATQHNNPNNYNGSGVVIGIIDSGIQRNNEVFDVINNPNTKTSDGNNKVCYEKDFTNGLGSNDDGNANTADDEIGHGTNCAGVAAGYDKNNIEYVGTAPDAKLAIAKMAYKDGTGEHWPSDMFINALKWLVNDLQFPTVDVISCSVCYWKDKDG
ncbi:MAG: S8 family serine peptidase, partial [Armatimonadetes bacterium]|nr:S8 family serine peptidase [Armatimonadota bacterium]